MNGKTLLGSFIALLIITRAGAGGIDALSAYTGTWKSEVTSFDTAYSKAGKRSSYCGMIAGVAGTISPVIRSSMANRKR
jgi:hypothetical protein